MIETFINGVWVGQQPGHGQKYRLVVNGVVTLESYWSDPQPQYIGAMSVTVNGVSASRHVAVVGVADNYRIECSLPITDSFAVPLAGLIGANGKTLMFNFLDGVAERDFAFSESGEWEVTEQQINKHLPEGQHFEFSGLHISVGE